jgi:hypothetical protein
MSEFTFPTPKALFNEHYPDDRFAISVRYSQSDGHTESAEKWIGGIPAHTEYFTITSRRGWNSDNWEMLQEAYESEGYETHLVKTSGTTRTRSGISHHAPTRLYVW